MKKFGFTLAEVLITLGIIGVVAALTAPALVQNAGTAKIGPTLSKVVATLENAHESMLAKEDVSSLYALAHAESSFGDDDYNESLQSAMLKYCDYLSEYIAGSSFEADPVGKNDFAILPKNYEGETGGTNALEGYILFHFSDNIDILFTNFAEQTRVSRGSFKGQFSSLIIDINGVKTKPNQFGKDMFFFSVDNSGAVLPHGSRAWSFANGDSSYAHTWDKNDTPYACNENKVAPEGYGCAGSIFENNLKVIYQ